jgi:uncharacterized membrane protein HdeD (DUF308 family)
MSLEPQPLPARAFAEEIQGLRDSWIWLLLLGVVLIILGVVAIGSLYIVTLAAAVTFSVLLMIGGGVELASAFWARRWSGVFLHLLAGVLYFVIGLFMARHPIKTAAALTLFLAILFTVGGLFRIVGALASRFPQWGWVFVNGVITLILGIMIWYEWPESSFWVIGLFIGIDLIFTGWSWVMLGLAARGLPRAAEGQRAGDGAGTGTGV